MLKRTLRAALAALAVVALLPAAARAQAVGAVTGVVTDDSGAVIPGVSVEATNAGTGLVRTAVTDADGRFDLPQLQPGRYNVKASLSGFRTVERQAVQVSVDDTTAPARVMSSRPISQLSFVREQQASIATCGCQPRSTRPRAVW